MHRNPKLVLIADDDENLVDILSHRCRQLGLAVERAHDGMSALTNIDELEPDLVLLDVNMPSGNGLSVCEMLSGDEDLRHVPVIILTGRQDQETIRRCHMLAAYYIPKGAGVWARLQPLIGELLDLDPSLWQPRVSAG